MSEKQNRFEKALRHHCFDPEKITASYNDFRRECKLRIQYFYASGRELRVEWPLEFCIRLDHIKSAFHLISLGLQQEQLNCALILLLNREPGRCFMELLKTLLENGAYVKSMDQCTNFREHEVIRMLCTVPTDPTSRYYILGMYLHYCCVKSRKCVQCCSSPLCVECGEELCRDTDQYSPLNRLFNMTWYKSVEYLISRSLDIRSYWDKSFVTANRFYGSNHEDPYYYDCYEYGSSRETNVTMVPHIDISVISIMLRMATGSTFSRNIFDAYAEHCNSSRRTLKHALDFVKLLPLFYHVGVDIRDSPLLAHTEPRLEGYFTYRASLMGQPRTLRDLARLRVRVSLTGPNVLVSSETLSGVPTSIREMITMRRLDITLCLEPDCVI